MQAYVIIATKSRAPETVRLVADLAIQTRPANLIVIVGTEAADFAEVDASGDGRVVTLIADRPGAARQRNVGIEHDFATLGSDTAAKSVFELVPEN